jgi:Flp pilus assembly pilin Flp
MLKLCVRADVAYRAFLDRLKGVLKDRAGTTVSEYALVLALVSVAVIVVLTNLGGALETKIQAVIDKLEAVPVNP